MIFFAFSLPGRSSNSSTLIGGLSVYAVSSFCVEEWMHLDYDRQIMLIHERAKDMCIIITDNSLVDLTVVFCELLLPKSLSGMWIRIYLRGHNCVKFQRNMHVSIACRRQRIRTLRFLITQYSIAYSFASIVRRLHVWPHRGRIEDTDEKHIWNAKGVSQKKCRHQSLFYTESMVGNTPTVLR